MERNCYFVWAKSHNYETKSWGLFTDPKRFDSLDLAKKEYHDKLKTYIAYGKLDLVNVTVTDAFGNIVEGLNETWVKEDVPEVEAQAEEVAAE